MMFSNYIKYGIRYSLRYILKYIIRVIIFFGIIYFISFLSGKHLFIANVHAESNSTMIPNRMSFQTGGGSPIDVPVSSYSYAFYPYMTFYGYTNISDNTWNYAGWVFWSRRTGDYDLSFMYEGAWNTNSNDALSFSISQGSTVYPCTNTPISVNNGRANRSIISVFCPNVSLASADFIINLEVPTSKLLTASSIGITPLNLYQQGTTTLQNEVSKATEQIKQTNDTIKDDNVDSSTNQGSSFFNDFDSGDEGSLTDIVSLPLQYVQHLNDTCQPFTIPTGNLGNITIPCLSSIWSSTSFAGIIKTVSLIINGIICYKLLTSLFLFFKDLKDPDDDKVEVMNL